MRKVLCAVLICWSIAGSTTIWGQSRIVKDPNAQPRKLASFHAMEVSSGIHVTLIQGSQQAVAVSAADTKYRDRIVTEVEDGVLKIYYNHNGWEFGNYDKMRLKAYVSCTSLDGLRISSGAEIEVDGDLQSNHLSMKLSSGGNFKGSVKVNSLDVVQGSGAQASITGTATSCQLEASSGSSIKAGDLQTDVCDASTSSGGSVTVTVNKELTASASSGGQIYYQGSGLIREFHTSSGGEINKR